MAKNNTSTSGKKSSFLKILWWVLTPILITLIFFGTRSMIPKKEVGGVVKKTSSSLSKFVPAKPKEEDWIFAWTATDVLMQENPHQKPSAEYAASNVAYSEKELSFVCFKGSKREDKIVLTRDSKEEKYMGYLFNKTKKEYTKIWLSPENDYFKGYIFANGGPKILATLKKQNHK